MFAILNSERRKNTKRHEVGEDTNGASMSTSHTLILSSFLAERAQGNIYIYMMTIRSWTVIYDFLYERMHETKSKKINK
jgi:hypothetical protein